VLVKSIADQKYSHMREQAVTYITILLFMIKFMVKDDGNPVKS